MLSRLPHRVLAPECTFCSVVSKICQDVRKITVLKNSLKNMFYFVVLKQQNMFKKLTSHISNHDIARLRNDQYCVEWDVKP